MRMSKILCILFSVCIVYGITQAQTIDEAIALFDKKQYTEAEKALNAIIVKEPKNAKAIMYLGKVYKEKNQFDRAKRELDRAIDTDPKYVDAYIEMARLQLDWPRRAADTKWRMARFYYQQALKYIPDSGETLLLLFESYVSVGEAEKGRKAVLDFFKENPDSLASYLAYAELIKATENNMLKRCDDLFDFYLKTIEYHPKDPKDLYNIGWGFFTVGDLEAAMAAYEDGLNNEIKPRYGTFFDLMVLSFESRFYDRSLAYFLKGFATMPEQQRLMFTQVSDVPPILAAEVKRLYKVTPEEFLRPEYIGVDPQLLLRKLRHYSIVWLRSKTEIKRKKPLELSGEVTFDEPYLIHWGKYNYIDYCFHFLLNDQEKEQFLLYTIPEQRETFRERYFHDHDPTPTNNVNELRDEFFKRIDYVYEEFKIMPNPETRSQYMRDFSGFDDRGRVYLKYGDPTEKYIDFGGPKRVFTPPDRQSEGLPGLLMNDASVGIQQFSLSSDTRAVTARSVIVKPNMSWAYFNYDVHLFFDFVELEKGYYSLVDDLTDAVTGSDIGWMLYMNRAYEGGMTGIYEVYLRRYDTGQIQNSGEFIVDNLVNDLHKKDEVITKYPTNLNEVITDTKPLYASLDYATFRGDSGKTRLELYTGVEYESLRFTKQAGQPETTTLLHTILIRDASLMHGSMDSLTSKISKPSGTASSNTYTFDQFLYYVPPGFTNIFVNTKNPEGLRESSHRFGTLLRSYIGSDLMMSDIEMASDIRAAEPGEKNFVKSNLVVLPYPFRQMKRDNPVFFYFEIYNLATTPQGASSLEIKYTASVIKQAGGVVDVLKTLAPGRKTEISIENMRSGVGSTFIEYIALDMKNLNPGDIELTITVTDQITKKSVSQLLRFKLY